MKQINKVAVIGSGVMGASIAAHIANSGTPVILLDIVPEGASDRSIIAKTAIQKLLKADPAPLTHKRKAKLITPGNLEDDLDLLKDVDWIVEAVLEDVEVKRSLYEKVFTVKNEDAVLSSNTSTIPMHVLNEKMTDQQRAHFMITHFFNPPRYMRLLELVTSDNADQSSVETIQQFCDGKLGKNVVQCHDTPGFIANRIGCYWMTCGVLDAIAMDVSVEEADAVLSRPIGVPKTGVFGLLDLIGVDLMPLIAKAFSATLPKEDAFLKIYQEPQIISDMIADGYTGRKGKGGFYRLNSEGGGKVKEAKNLQTGEYHTASKPKLASADAARKGVRHLFEHEDNGGKYARAVMLKTLAYTVSLVPEIADDIAAVDEAMKRGYNWKYGPFELIDRLGEDGEAGTSWLVKALEKDGIDIPGLLKIAEGKTFYQQEEGEQLYLSTEGEYVPLIRPKGRAMLSDYTHGKTPVLKNPSARLWDIGDGIACLEYTSKMNSVDPLILEMMMKSIDVVKKDFKGLVIANDADNFCVGANIGVLLFAANVAAWKQIRGIIKQGQDTYMALKYAPFPVVVGTSGMALGGGCELLMHADAVQAHVETYTGLVEVGVGIIPGWGGCKEMVVRHLQSEEKKRLSVAQMGGMFALSVKQAVRGEGTASLTHPIQTMNAMPAVSKAFQYIATAHVAKSAEEAKDMLILTDKDSISMHRERVLPDAKAKCLSLAESYEAPTPPRFHLPGKTAETALVMALQGFVRSGKATPHDEVVCSALAKVLAGGTTDITKELTEQDMLDLELDWFMELVKTQGTMDRVEHMLETGKPLRN